MEIRNCPEGSRIYIWDTGDTLGSVAQRSGTTEQLIQGANPSIDFRTISAGTSICLPQGSAPIARPEVETEPSTDMEPLSNRRPGPPVTRACPPNSRTYIWTQGSTLQGVALQYGVTQQQIRDANPDLDFGRISSGTNVCIPARTPECSDGVLHAVRQGDTITSIARSHGVTAGEVMERNPYVDPTNLQIGTLLCIPPRATTPTPPQRPTPTPPQRPTPTPPQRPTPTPPQRPTPTPPQRPTPTPPQRPIPTPTPPTPPTTPIPAPSSCPAGYTPGTVRYGETYADILIRYNISYQAFQLSNPSLNLGRLIPGQRYCIPPTGSRGLCPPGSNSHVMALGENLQSVAALYNTTPSALLRLNANLAPGDFIPGRVICI